MANKLADITIIGAGLTGPLLALYLAKRGLSVDLFERRPDLRKVKISAGRSINLAISVRGLHALGEVGLRDEVLRRAIPMKGRMLHAVKGELSFAPYGKNESEVINAISRAELNIALLNALDRYSNVKVYFNERLNEATLSSPLKLRFNNPESGDSCIEAKTVIGADGSASCLRDEMLKQGGFDFSQSFLEHSYKELVIPANSEAQHVMEKNALHIWPRGGYMMIALPNLDGSFTCTVFLPQNGELSFSSLASKAKVTQFFKDHFSDALLLMPSLLDDFFTNPTGALVTVKCAPWYLDNRALLIGDAAHAIVPFYGQGANCAFEDCSYLNQLLDNENAKDLNWERIYKGFYQLRKVNTDAIADLAVDNFIEMRDLVADPKFLLKKRLEHALEERFPGKFISKYSMVTFHRIPYEVALKKGRVQDEYLAKVVREASAFESINLDEVWRALASQ